MLSTKYKSNDVICYLEDGDINCPIFGIVAYEADALREDKKSDKIRKNSNEKRVWFYTCNGSIGFMLEENVIPVKCSFKKGPHTKDGSSSGTLLG